MQGLQPAEAMTAQRQLLRSQNPVNWSGGTTYFINNEQAYKSSDRLDLLHLLVRGGIDCSTTDAECGCDTYINVSFIYQCFCPHPLSLTKH